MTHTDLLQQVYDEALEKAFEPNCDFGSLDAAVLDNIEVIASRSESNKAVLSVIVTLLVSKIAEPDLDIRYHYARMDNGFAARGIDTNHVTPFMKRVSFPAMAESGWKTASLAVDMPFDLSYPGIITPPDIKSAFLSLIDQFQSQDANPADILLYMFTLLIIQRDNMQVELAKPHRLSITAIINLLKKHFNANYSGVSGASRLPTLAVYAAYQCMMNQVARYEGKILCPLESHHSADFRSGRIGDIDINNTDNTVFEGVEIKHGVPIVPGFVSDAYEKFKVHNTDRYYLLTTANVDAANWDAINAEIERIAQIHGCQVIVNGVYDTLKYYLRLLTNTADFIDCYVECMKSDETIKYLHKTMWNDVVSGNI